MQGQRQPAPHVSGLGWPVKPPTSQVLWCARLTSSFWFAVYAWNGTKTPRFSPVCTLSARGKPPLCAEKGVAQTDLLPRLLSRALQLLMGDNESFVLLIDSKKHNHDLPIIHFLSSNYKWGKKKKSSSCAFISTEGGALDIWRFKVKKKFCPLFFVEKFLPTIVPSQRIFGEGQLKIYYFFPYNNQEKIPAYVRHSKARASLPQILRKTLMTHWNIMIFQMKKNCMCNNYKLCIRQFAIYKNILPYLFS